MPPFVSRKRHASTPPPGVPTPKKNKKPSLFDTLDEPLPMPSVHDNKNFLNGLIGSGSDSSLSDEGSSAFEDVLPPVIPKRRKLVHREEAEDEEEEMNWEDAMPIDETNTQTAVGPSGDLELTLDKNHRFTSLTNQDGKKKGPSKIERQIRMATHCMHVQFLLFHNLMRNSWLCDKELQKILVEQLPERMKREVSHWERASGVAPEVVEPAAVPQKNTASKRRGGRQADPIQSQREWGRPAERQESGSPNMSRGDPVIRLLRYLAAYWKKRFRITAPGLRKQGYKALATLEEEITSFHNDKHDAGQHGERIDNLEKFKECARKCEGSRDVGAKLFTALIRGLGIEARLVASLQPIGFGWSKTEEAVAKKKKLQNIQAQQLVIENGAPMEGSSGLVYSKNIYADSPVRRTKSTSKATVTSKPSEAWNGTENTPINLSDDSELSSVPSDENSEDDDSVIDITPFVPQRRPDMNFDKDLPFPIYWTEVISPITHEIYPVDAMILSPASTSKAEQIAAFEPRGARAEKAKQVIAYVVAFSQDGTAKDVTTRYLKRHLWPGKTKGFRIPPEKIPVLDKRGKVKHHEMHDWFKTVMSGYSRTQKMRTIVDDLEEEKDLKPLKPEKKDTKEGIETLQGYKQSADFVLERHLRREEALLPGSQPVKTFVTGKGEKAKEEPVFRRKDVVVCRTGESWHKEGRQVKTGEYPMKMVPVRAVTMIRKREVEEAERDTGEKLKQGLYAWDQTEWIIPPPIVDGIIPKNAFGNMDCFVPTMVPEGATHITLRGTMKICKRLGIDYAEAVTGFEFGNQRAVPVITGVIVAAENENLVIDAWEKDEEERRIKEEGKREKAALAMWRKFLMGLRIVERVQEEYGGDEDGHMREEINPFTNKNRASNKQQDNPQHDGDEGNIAGGDDMAGGFLLDDGSGDENGLKEEDNNTLEYEGGGFIVEDEPVSVGRPHQRPKSEKLRFQSESENEGIGMSEDGSNGEGSRELTSTSATTPKTPSGVPINASLNRHSKAKQPQLPAITAQEPIGTAIVKLRETLDHPGPSSKAKLKRQPRKKAVPKAPPKQTPARPSRTATKSSYFVHADSAEEDPESSSEPSSSEEEEIYRPPARKVTVKGIGSTPKEKAKRGRPRKTL